MARLPAAKTASLPFTRQGVKWTGRSPNEVKFGSVNVRSCTFQENDTKDPSPKPANK
jgi:hypothetical protein